MMKMLCEDSEEESRDLTLSSLSPIGTGILSSFGKSLKQYRQNEKGYEGMKAISSQSFLL
nr:hypothetical protein [uncultured Dialister sp.]